MRTEWREFDQTFVHPKPKSIRGAKALKRYHWRRHIQWYQLFKFIKDLRQQGVFLTSCIEMEDCLEVRFRAKVECTIIEPMEGAKSRRLFTADEIRMIRKHGWNRTQVEIHLGKSVRDTTITAIHNRTSYKDVEDF